MKRNRPNFTRHKSNSQSAPVENVSRRSFFQTLGLSAATPFPSSVAVAIPLARFGDDVQAAN
jgi:hypothetical protein